MRGGPCAHAGTGLRTGSCRRRLSGIGKTVAQLETIHAFNDAVEGGQPSALIEGADGQLYGLASSGGSYGQGTFFVMSRDGSVTVLHHFSAALDGVQYPSNLVQGADGNFYGTSFRVVFQMTPVGAVRILYSFPNASFQFLSHLAQPWGISTDIPVPGDYDGDGKTDIAMYRPSKGYLYILQSSTHFTTYVARPWGLSADIPIP
jgi:uncharacterized repeat protein (TIGR03803 family)